MLDIMVLSMLLALTTVPAVLGTQEAIRDSQSKTRREEHRGQRCNLVATCVRPSIRSQEINNKAVVLKDSKLYINTETLALSENAEGQARSNSHPFCGYFLPYPDADHEGLVTTITDEAPILNWVYCDRETYEIKYGVREFAQPNLTGPFDCTRQDRRMIFESWEGFVAVEEYPGIWALYFDRDDNGLKDKVPFGTRVLDVELTRREKKLVKPEPDEAQTLDEMMAQHQERTKQEEQEREVFYKEQEQVVGQEAGYPAPMAADRPQIPIPSQEALPNSPTDASDIRSFWSEAPNGTQSEAGTRITPPGSEYGRHGTPEQTSGKGEHYKHPYVEDGK